MRFWSPLEFILAMISLFFEVFNVIAFSMHFWERPGGLCGARGTCRFIAESAELNKISSRPAASCGGAANSKRYAHSAGPVKREH